MKSICHEVRRNSPSVAQRSPVASCGNDLADSGVFHLPETVGVQLTFGEGRSCPDELGGTKDAADVVGAKRGEWPG
jgi:hypothetical protein